MSALNRCLKAIFQNESMFESYFQKHRFLRAIAKNTSIFESYVPIKILYFPIDSYCVLFPVGLRVVYRNINHRRCLGAYLGTAEAPILVGALPSSLLEVAL